MRSVTLLFLWLFVGRLFAADDGHAIYLTDTDGARRLVAYSVTGSFPTDSASMPPAMRLLLRQAEARKCAWPHGGNVQARALNPVEPLCTAEWGQGSPYNLMCPTERFEWNHCLAGCVAIAVAQAMYCYRHPVQGQGSIKYFPIYWNGGKPVQRDFSQSIYQWDLMLDSYRGTGATPAQREAVAQLCYDVGIAVKMDYGISSSGAFLEDALVALKEYFGYDASTISFVLRDDFATQEEWNDLVFSELSAGRPLIYRATSTTDGGSDAHHAFLVDGFDDNGFIHVNWGWNGSGNGYFDIGLMDVSGYNYTINHGMIIGLQPAATSVTPVTVPPEKAPEYLLPNGIILQSPPVTGPYKVVRPH